MRPFFSFVVVLAFPTSSWATTPTRHLDFLLAQRNELKAAAGMPRTEYTVTTAPVQCFEIGGVKIVKNGTMYDYHDSTDALKFGTEKRAINKSFLFFIGF